MIHFLVFLLEFFHWFCYSAVLGKTGIKSVLCMLLWTASKKTLVVKREDSLVLDSSVALWSVLHNVSLVFTTLNF